MSNKNATRLALALYPPSWRARYADEVKALLEESNSLRDVASLAAAAPAPPPSAGEPARGAGIFGFNLTFSSWLAGRG